MGSVTSYKIDKDDRFRREYKRIFLEKEKQMMDYIEKQNQSYEEEYE